MDDTFAFVSGHPVLDAPASVHTAVQDVAISRIGMSSGVTKPIANTAVFSIPSAVPAREIPAIPAISVKALKVTRCPGGLR